MVARRAVSDGSCVRRRLPAHEAGRGVAAHTRETGRFIFVFTGTIGLVGDINLRRCLDTDETCLDEVAGELASVDVRLGNLEGAFAEEAAEEELPFKPGWFHGQPEMARCLVGRFDAVACANNVHYGDAIVQSLQVLDQLGIGHTGAGADFVRARTPAIVSSAAGSVGMLSYTSVFEPSGQAATATSPGVATVKALTAYEPNPRVLQMPGAPALVHTWADPEEMERACRDVRSLREHVDVVVVYLHFGVSMSPTVHEYQRQLAHALVDAGANIVAGSHSHTPGGVEFYGSGVVFYSLGNFVFNTGFHPDATRDGVLAKLEIRGSAVRSCTVLPTFRHTSARATLVAPPSREGARISEMVRSRSEEFHTVVHASEDGLVLSPPDRAGTHLCEHPATPPH